MLERNKVSNEKAQIVLVLPADEKSKHHYTGIQ